MSSYIRHLILYGVASLTLTSGIGISALAEDATQPENKTPVEKATADESTATTPPPSEVTSDSMEYDMENQLARLVGNVKVRDGDLFLQSDQMVLHFSEKSEIQRIEAKGNVLITRGTEKASSGKATFEVEQGLITLTDKPILYRGPNRIRNADVITFDRNGGKAKAVPAPGEQLIIEFFHQSDEDIKALDGLTGAMKNAPEKP